MLVHFDEIFDIYHTYLYKSSKCVVYIFTLGSVKKVVKSEFYSLAGMHGFTVDLRLLISKTV